MLLYHSRYAFGPNTTAGKVYEIHPDRRIGGIFVCNFLEDKYREVGEKKVPGETCIPTGFFDIELVHESKMALRYYEKYPWFKGLPWIKDVPGFSHVRVHPGNFHTDSKGCPLTGSWLVKNAVGDYEARESVVAYRIFCQVIYRAFDLGDTVQIEVTDHEAVL